MDRGGFWVVWDTGRVLDVGYVILGVVCSVYVSAWAWAWGVSGPALNRIPAPLNWWTLTLGAKKKP